MAILDVQNSINKLEDVLHMSEDTIKKHIEDATHMVKKFNKRYNVDTLDAMVADTDTIDVSHRLRFIHRVILERFGDKSDVSMEMMFLYAFIKDTPYKDICDNAARWVEQRKSGKYYVMTYNDKFEFYKKIAMYFLRHHNEEWLEHMCPGIKIYEEVDDDIPLRHDNDAFGYEFYNCILRMFIPNVITISEMKAAVVMYLVHDNDVDKVFDTISQRGIDKDNIRVIERIGDDNELYDHQLLTPETYFSVKEQKRDRRW